MNTTYVFDVWIMEERKKLPQFFPGSGIPSSFQLFLEQS